MKNVIRLIVFLGLIYAETCPALGFGWLKFWRILPFFRARPAVEEIYEATEADVVEEEISLDDPAVLRIQYEDLIRYLKNMAVHAKENARIDIFGDDAVFIRLIENTILPRLQPGLPSATIVFIGNTGVGKSTFINSIFNAPVVSTSGERMHSKQPVVFTSPELVNGQVLERLFPNFPRRQLTDPKEAAEPIGPNGPTLLYVPRAGVGALKGKLIFDLPDVDGDNLKNKEVAKLMAEASDLVVAMVTDSSYAQEAVSSFLKEMSTHAKRFALVFGKVNEKIILENRKENWATWLKDFVKVTGIEPDRVFLVPNDPDRAMSFDLPLYEALSSESKPFTAARLQGGIDDLRLEEVSFFEKLEGVDSGTLIQQTIIGASLSALNGNRKHSGVLKAITDYEERGRLYKEFSEEYEKTVQELSWIPLPRLLFNEELDRWKHARRSHVTRQAKAVIDVFTWPFRKIFGADLARETEAFRVEEQKQAREVVSNIVMKLQELADSKGGSFLSDEARALLNDVRLPDRVAQAHASGMQSEFQNRFQEALREKIQEIADNDEELVDKVMSADSWNHVVLRPATCGVGAVLVPFFGPGGGGFMTLFSKLFTSPIGLAIASSLGGYAGTGVASAANKVPVGAAEKLYVAIQELYRDHSIANVVALLAQEIKPVIEEIAQGQTLLESPDLPLAKSCAERISVWAKSKAEN